MGLWAVLPAPSTFLQDSCPGLQPPPPPSAPHRAGLPCPSAKWSRLWGGLDCRLCLVPQSGARCSLELACAAPQSLRGVFLIRSCDLNLWVKLGLAGRSRTGLPGVCLPSGPWHLPGRPQPCGAGGEPACPDHPPGEGTGKPPPPPSWPTLGPLHSRRG